MPYQELLEDSSKSLVMETKGMLDAGFERIARRMHAATGVNLGDYVRTSIHERTFTRRDEIKWQLVLYVSPRPLPESANAWLAEEADRAEQRRRTREDVSLIIISSRAGI